MNIFQSSLGFLGRALLSVIFIASAVGKIMDWQGTLQFFNQSLTNWLALNVGNTFFQPLLEWSLENSSTLLLAAVIFELLGGALVFLGLWVRLGAVLLILFLVPTTMVFHHFWELQGDERHMQMIHFMKNLSICGGLLYVLAMGKGFCRKSSKHSEAK